MASRLDQIIVLYIECAETEDISEILEIHICLIDVLNHDGIQCETLLVQPSPALDEFDLDLTPGPRITFKSACQILEKKYLTTHRTWAAYGDYARIQFEDECILTKVAYPFSPTYINIKNLFALRSNLDREVGLVQAVSIQGLDTVPSVPQGMTHAWSSTMLLMRLLEYGKG